MPPEESKNQEDPKEAQPHSMASQDTVPYDAPYSQNTQSSDISMSGAVSNPVALAAIESQASLNNAFGRLEVEAHAEGDVEMAAPAPIVVPLPHTQAQQAEVTANPSLMPGEDPTIITDPELIARITDWGEERLFLHS